MSPDETPHKLTCLCPKCKPSVFPSADEFGRDMWDTKPEFNYQISKIHRMERQLDGRIRNRKERRAYIRRALK